MDEQEKQQLETAGPREKVGLTECPPPRTLHLIEDEDQVLVTVLWSLCIACQISLFR